MIHRKLPSLMTPAEAIARVAATALTQAAAQQTAPAGSISVPNSDGTRTVLGAVNSSGSTMATHVGDTTPPGRPIGVTAKSSGGVIVAFWSGRLEGGVPADFDHVTFYARSSDGTQRVTLGKLSREGSVTSAAMESGSAWAVWATAEDDACLSDGTPAHNVSEESDESAVVVVAPKDGADGIVLSITSTHGLVFKDSLFSTTLQVSVMRGSDRITDQTALVAAFGATARIEWRWQRDGSDVWGTILSTDSRVSDAGFSLSVSPADVDARTSFIARLII